MNGERRIFVNQFGIFLKGKEFEVGSIPFSKSPTKMTPLIQYVFRVIELSFSKFKSGM